MTKAKNSFWSFDDFISSSIKSNVTVILLTVFFPTIYPKVAFIIFWYDSSLWLVLGTLFFTHRFKNFF